MRASNKVNLIEQILENKLIYSFFKKIITEGYLRYANGYEQEMTKLLEEIFYYIEKSIQKHTSFESTISTLTKDIFKVHVQDFWFSKIYKNYKMNIKPLKRFELLKSLIAGTKLMDVGCGDGYFSKLLTGRGYDVFMTDVVDFRDKDTTNIPFKKMTDSKIIPYPDKYVHTTVTLSVLHHINSEDLNFVLSEMKRVSKRLIIEEECYGIQHNVGEFKSIIEDDEQLKEFITMSDEDQIKFMVLLDYFSNVVVQGLLNLNLPFGFKSINQWRDLFMQIGLRTAMTVLLGFQDDSFHRTCRVIFILDEI